MSITVNICYTGENGNARKFAEEMMQSGTVDKIRSEEGIPDKDKKFIVKQEETIMSKKLAAYFSASGVTAGLAKNLAEAAGADLYEIRPAVPYTNADLNWQDKNSRSSVEMKDKSFRPAIADTNANIADYDTIFVGFPIWWYVAPTIINTFLEAYDFSGKTIVLFATSGGSGMGNSAKELKLSVSDTAVIKEGKRFAANTTVSELKKWVESLGVYRELVMDREAWRAVIHGGAKS